MRLASMMLMSLDPLKSRVNFVVQERYHHVCNDSVTESVSIS